jgi:flagellar hook-length control protein FliK
MDSAAAPQVLGSAPQRLAVGVRDGSLGWVEVRAHASAGQVAAVVTTGSSEAHAVLSAHLPEMRDYLAGHQVEIGQLSTEQFSPRDGGAGSQGGNGREEGHADAEASPEGVAAAGFSGDAMEDSLSYINVRV